MTRRRAPVSGDGSVPMGSDSPSRAGPQPGVEEADPVTRITLSAPLPGGGALGFRYFRGGHYAALGGGRPVRQTP
jgi:hypothetical protein